MRPGFESFKTRAHLFIDCRRRCRRYSQQSRRYCHRWSDSHPSMCRCHPGRCCCLWFRYWYPATGDPSRPEQVCTASTHTVWTVHRTGIGESLFGQKIRSILCVRRAANHVYAGCVGVRTICAGELSGIRTDVGQNMVVTVIGRCRAGCKIFGICHVAARIVRTYAVDGKLSGDPRESGS